MTAASAGTEARTLTDAEVVSERNDLEMLRRSYLWPHGKICPMKRAQKRGDDPDLIMVVDRGAGDPTLINDPRTARYLVFEGPMGLRDRPLLAAGDDWLLRTLVDAGWLVD